MHVTEYIYIRSVSCTRKLSVVNDLYYTAVGEISDVVWWPWCWSRGGLQTGQFLSSSWSRSLIFYILYFMLFRLPIPDISCLSQNGEIELWTCHRFTAYLVSCLQSSIWTLLPGQGHFVGNLAHIVHGFRTKRSLRSLVFVQCNKHMLYIA